MINDKIVLNVYENPKLRSKISTQLLYGEKFKILSQSKKWIKIKTSFDNYIGYIKYNNFIKTLQSTHKVFKLKTKIFKKPFNKKNCESKKYILWSKIF